MRKYIKKMLMRSQRETTIRERAVKSLTKMVADYSEWYDQNGLYLPPDYDADPAQWNEALHKMKRSFDLLYDDMNGEGELFEAWKKYSEGEQRDLHEVHRIEAEIREGLELFGKQLFYLNDPKHTNDNH